MAAAFTSPFFLGLVLSSLFALWATVYGWRRRPGRGAVPFAAAMGCVALWTASYAVALLTPPGPARLALEGVRWVGTALVGVPWFVFALEYTGLDRHLTRGRTAALLVVPVFTVVAAWTSAYHGLFWADWSIYTWRGLVIVDEEWGPAFYAYLAYTYGLVGVGTVLLLRESLTADDLYTDQVVSLVAGALVPVTASVVATFLWTPTPGLDLTPHAFALAGIPLGNALVRYRFLEAVPASRRIGRDAVVRNMRDGVIVLEGDGEVIDVNPVAREALAADRSSVVGRRVDEVLPGVPVEDPGTVETFDAPGDGRTYEVHASPMTDPGGRETGTVVVLRDVTDRRTHEQRLTVLNRVLRHNIRNDMNAIGGMAAILAGEVDGDDAARAEEIRTVTGEIVDLADRARRIEQLMARRQQEPTPSDVDDLVEDVVAWVRERNPDVEVETEVDADARIPTRGILKTVVRNLVDNAARHNDADDPRVSVTVEVDRAPSPAVEVTVADNGPGIPPHERAVLLEGTETALGHGSGLGLWLVHWGVQSLDGTVTLGENDPRGSVVRVRVPVVWSDDLPGGAGERTSLYSGSST